MSPTRSTEKRRIMNMSFKPEVEVSTPGETDVVVKRKFNAPVDLVWRCYTDPALLPRWLGGYPGWTMPVCEMDLRVGGTYTWRWRNEEQGMEFGFTGIFEEVILNRRIVHSERPVDVEEMGESRNVIEFVPLGDMSELIMTMSYANAEVRRSVLDTGMTDGMGVSFDRLDALLQQV